MSTGALAGTVMVPFFGALLCITPAITRPTVPFGVRVPAERARATVIRRGVILLLEVAADLGCFWIARRKITAVKHAEDWYAGHVLTLLALVNLSLLLAALRNWQVYRLSGPGSALPILPFAVGLVVLAAPQAWSRLAACTPSRTGSRSPPPWTSGP
jgi:hypothetical protein